MRRFILALVPFVLTACGATYDRAVNNPVREALGPAQVRGYQWLSYPVTNFGVMTAYDRIGRRVDDVDDKHFICDTWSCIDLDPETLSPREQLTLAGHAAVGEGPAVTFSEARSSLLTAGVALQDFFAAIPEIAAKFKRGNWIVTEFSCDRIYKRLLRRDRFIAGVMRREDTHPLKQAWNSGRLVLVVGDIVIEGLRAKITAETKTEPTLELTIDASQTIADAGFSLERKSNTAYEIRADKPVVAARVLARIPGDRRAALEGPDDWSDWLSYSSPRRRLEPVSAEVIIPRN